MPVKTGLAARALALPIRVYRVFSPLFPGSCRFQPTCSDYALAALQDHGAWRGSALVLRRMLRCHPVALLGGSSGYDPPPPAVRANH